MSIPLNNKFPDITSPTQTSASLSLHEHLSSSWSIVFQWNYGCYDPVGIGEVGEVSRLSKQWEEADFKVVGLASVALRAFNYCFFFVLVCQAASEQISE